MQVAVQDDWQAGLIISKAGWEMIGVEGSMGCPTGCKRCRMIVHLPGTAEVLFLDTVGYSEASLLSVLGDIQVSLPRMEYTHEDRGREIMTNSPKCDISPGQWPSCLFLIGKMYDGHSPLSPPLTARGCVDARPVHRDLIVPRRPAGGSDCLEANDDGPTRVERRGLRWSHEPSFPLAGVIGRGRGASWCRGGKAAANSSQRLTRQDQNSHLGYYYYLLLPLFPLIQSHN